MPSLKTWKFIIKTLKVGKLDKKIINKLALKTPPSNSHKKPSSNWILNHKNSTHKNHKIPDKNSHKNTSQGRAKFIKLLFMWLAHELIWHNSSHQWWMFFWLCVRATIEGNEEVWIFANDREIEIIIEAFYQSTLKGKITQFMSSSHQ